MKRNAAQALLAVLLLSFVALEFLYPSGPEITGESFHPDRRKYETVRAMHFQRGPYNTS